MTVPPVNPPAKAAIDALLHEATRHCDHQAWPQALACLDTAIRSAPHRNDIHNQRARLFDRMGRLDDALESLDRALAIDPRNTHDLRNRGIILRKLGRLSEALASYEALLAIRPDDVSALVRRAELLNQLDRRQESLESIEQAAHLGPDDPEVLNARVIILDNLGHYAQALQVVDRMLALDPANVYAINNAGMLLARLGRFQEALRCYERSLLKDPDQPQARYNTSLIRLSLGDWRRGFEEFEIRWETDSLKRSRLPGLGPLWLGHEDIRGKTLLLYHEQGYGDTLMSVRYIPLLADRGARVILAVPPALRKLMQSVPGVTKIISSHDGESTYNLQCPLMSLPLAFRTTPETVPTPVPYLHADPTRVSYWEQRLGPRSKPRIGLVWGGRRYAPINYPRDVPLESLEPLLNFDDAEFISLQKEIDATDRPVLARLPQVRALGEELEDFADTAALIATLDLVIAADTAVAHLAGALGKPVWLLNRYAACWRWQQAGERSVWYPTMRQFRQPSVGNWSAVIAEVSRAATQFLQDPNGTTHLPPKEVSPIWRAAGAAKVRTPKEKIRFVCATRQSREDFFTHAPLGRSLPLYRSYPQDQPIELRLFPRNSEGLSGLYNLAIEEARADPAILVFMHDDVYLSDYFWAQRLTTALNSFDLVGLVGNKRRVSGQTSWMFLDDRFTCDSYDNFSGVLGHGNPFPDLRQLSVYGEPGVEVKLLDGVLLAIRSQTLHERDLRFDPRFDFHFYDMDFCRQAELREIKMGTCAMALVHQSPGELGGPAWRSAYRIYAEKYGEPKPT